MKRLVKRLAPLRRARVARSHHMARNEPPCDPRDRTSMTCPRGIALAREFLSILGFRELFPQSIR
eukprot:scaffold12055_cov63-Phaeocystis_antarctica.AAC.2